MSTKIKQTLPKPLVFALAAATGLAVANIYYNQPMLGLIGRSLGDNASALVPSVTQLGYAAGLFLVVPFGDIVERKRLILSQFIVLALALLLASWSPNAAILVVASLLIGVSASVAQQIVPLAAHLAPPDRRGAVVGTVMAGLLCGILLSRTVAGTVAAQFGWRAMFLLAVPLMLLTAFGLYRLLPKSQGDVRLGYRALLTSMVGLWRDLPALRQAAFTQALLFAAFSTFWTVLALHLQQPPYALGAQAAGLFGIVGAVGILAAPLAGRLADKQGPRRVIVAGCIVAGLAWVVFGLWGSLAGIIAGVILLDFAVQAVLISNQHVVFSLRPEARARLNTLFMTTMFIGGALGSMSAVAAWQAGGWPLVVMLGGAFSGGAVLVELLNQWRRPA